MPQKRLLLNKNFKMKTLLLRHYSIVIKVSISHNCEKFKNWGTEEETVKNRGENFLLFKVKSKFIPSAIRYFIACPALGNN